MIEVIVGVVCLVIGAAVGVFFSKSSLNTKAKFIIDDAKKMPKTL